MSRAEKYFIWSFLLFSLFFRFYVIFLPGWVTKELFQVDMAKGLAQHHFNIFQNSVSFISRMVDWNTNPPYLWTEDFPLFNLISAFFIRVFPMDPLWIGRFLSFVFLIFGLCFFYLFLKSRYSEKVAWWAILLFSWAPISLANSTSFIPDMAMVACFLGCAYFLQKSKFIWAVICGVGITSFRYYGAFLFLPLLGLWMSKNKLWDKRFYLFFLVPAIIPALWLLYSFLYLNHPLEARDHWGDWRTFLWEDGTYYRQMFLRLSKYSVTFPGFIFLMIGCANQRKDLFLLFSIPMMAGSLAFFTKGHANHEHYQLNFIPFLSIWAAIGIAYILDRFRKYSLGFSLVLLILVSYLSLEQTYKLLRFDSGPKMVGAQIQKLTQPKDKIAAIQDVPDPGIFVYGDRQGWMVYPEFLKDPKAPLLYEKADYLVLRLSESILLKNIDITLGAITQLKQKYLTVWEYQDAVGKHKKCGMTDFFLNHCPREKYYFLILKL